MSQPGYDAWKLSTPPHQEPDEEPEVQMECECGEWLPVEQIKSVNDGRFTWHFCPKCLEEWKAGEEAQTNA